MFRGKKYQDAAKQIEKNTQYDAAEGFGLICKTASAKFDETVELHVKLGVDSRHADQYGLLVQMVQDTSLSRLQSRVRVPQGALEASRKAALRRYHFDYSK